MNFIANIIGIVLLLLWIFFIPVGRRTMRNQGSVMHATVFQFNILPFIVGINLILTGSLWWLVIGVVAWFLAIPYFKFFTYFFPLIAGWTLGTFVFSEMYPDSKFWYWGGGIIGFLFMVVFCSMVVAIILTPPRK